MSTIRATLQLASWDDIECIINIDAKRKDVTTKKDAYVQDNRLSYTVLVNTWLLTIRKWSALGWCGLLDYMKKHGLIETIKFTSSEADCWLRGMQDDLHPFTLNLLHDIMRYSHAPNMRDDESRDINNQPIAAFLFVLRYPKRFSPLHANMIEESGYTDFLNWENRNKLRSRQELPQYVVKRVRDVICHMCDWDAFLAEVESLDICDYSLTSGSCVEGRAPIMKLRAIADEEPRAIGSMFGYTIGGFPTTTLSWGTGNYDHPCKLMAVPKNYKSPRMIAPEPAYRQARAKEIFRILEKYLPSAINLRDQSQNQEKAYLGSIDGSWGTIDLSKASDSILKRMLWDFFPCRVADVLQNYLSTSITVKGKIRTLHMLSTSGNALTFILEAIIIWGVSQAGVETVCVFDNEDTDDDAVSVYGDDTAVKSQYAATVIDFLTMLGFVVNEDKTFVDPQHLYRESCGVEYYNGYNTSCHYFPRSPIRGTVNRQTCSLSNFTYWDGHVEQFADTTTSLIKLQHGLYLISPDASAYIHALVREARPNMTESPVGQEEATDLWGYLCDNPKKVVPCGQITERADVNDALASLRKRIPSGSFTEVPLQDTLPVGYEKSLIKWSEVCTWCDVHMYPTTSYRKCVISDERDEQIYQIYRYTRFLKDGPKYDDELSRLLRVSSDPRRTLDTPDTVFWKRG